MKFRYIIGNLCILFFTFFSHTAFADLKVFPATSCQLWGGDKHLARYLSYSQYGKLSNTHPSKRLGVVCPLSRDRPDRPMDLAVYWTDAYLGSNGSVGNFTCRFRSNSLWGSTSSASSSADSSNWGDSFYPLNQSGYSTMQRGRFWWTNLPGLYSDSGSDPNTAFDYYTSTYTLFCQIPPLYMGNESYLSSFVIREN